MSSMRCLYHLLLWRYTAIFCYQFLKGQGVEPPKTDVGVARHAETTEKKEMLYFIVALAH